MRRIHVVATILAALLSHLSMPAMADHIAAITVTQLPSTGRSVTLQVDLTLSGNGGSGIFNWRTGDGGSASVNDGANSSGQYAGDANGTGTIVGTRPAGIEMGTFSWIRTAPTSRVARTRVTYNYASPGRYTVTWDDSSPPRQGSLVVTVADFTGPSAADCTVGPPPAGSISYQPPIVNPTVPTLVNFHLTFRMDCTGTYPALGVYDLVIDGPTAEVCGGGQATADATVTGSKASTSKTVSSGRWNHHREGIHLYGYPDPSRPEQSGEFYLPKPGGGTQRYALNLWLDLAYAEAAVCPGSGGAITGHATVTTD